MMLRLISQPLPTNDETGNISDSDWVLGRALLGYADALPSTEWPTQKILARLPESHSNCIEEKWLTSLAPITGHFEGIDWCRSGDVLYGTMALEEADHANSGVRPLEAASEEAYNRIFRLLELQQLPHLWRLWNYLSDINEESDGLERYRQFNIGRQRAFLKFKRQATGNVPAACAIGLKNSPLSIAFIAGKQPVVAIENPRQVSAYHYPAEYGPRSPTFSRAALAYPPKQEILFISGTASIVGHQTVHPGDVEAQCRESMLNISTVIDEANKQNRSQPFALPEFTYRVYIRHTSDSAPVSKILEKVLGTDDVIYVQADICRDDLLVEIEAMASHSLETPDDSKKTK